LGLLKKAKFRNISIILVSLFIIPLFFSPSLSYAEKIDINGIRYWSYPDYTRVVIDLSSKAAFTKNRLSNPDRLYLDIQNTVIRKELQTNLSIKNGMLKNVRAGQFNTSTVRVVLDLEKIINYKAFTLEEPSRIVVDIYGPKTFSVKRIIVIDPGHGGKDPGAVGPNNLFEKDIVLDISLKLKKILDKKPDYEVFLTRDRDIFVPLEERTSIAISKSADLFVSIHVNASRRKTLKGIETYFLNWTNNEEAQKVAARENQISLKQIKKIQKKRNELDFILGDLKRGIKRDESIKLANFVQQAMVIELDKRYRHIVDLGVKWAPFYVLFGAEMPSVLVEVSFISNPLEGKLLRKSKYRNDLAKSIASGIKKYISVTNKEQKIADIGKSVATRD
jgi:N-acetylmuramoyl-L-alanine amidase